jgi:hypothetical protein
MFAAGVLAVFTLASASVKSTKNRSAGVRV